MGWIKDIFEGIVDEGYDKLCDIGVCDRTAITYDSNGGRRSIADRIIDPYYEREANIRRAEANEKEARKMEKFSESVYENARFYIFFINRVQMLTIRKTDLEPKARQTILELMEKNLPAEKLHLRS